MADRDLVRRWVGSSPDDDAIDIILARDDIDSPEAAALDILYRRRADLVSGPGGFDVAGDYSETGRHGALKALDATIGQLETLTGTGTGLPSLHVAPIEGPRGIR